MLKEVSIKNLFTFEDVKVTQISNILTLVGKNGVGKTTFFRVLDELSKHSSNSNDYFLDYVYNDFRIQIKVEIDGHLFTYVLKGRGHQLKDSLLVQLNGKKVFSAKQEIESEGQNSLFLSGDEELVIRHKNNVSLISAGRSMLDETFTVYKYLAMINDFFLGIRYHTLDNNIIGKQDEILNLSLISGWDQSTKPKDIPVLIAYFYYECREKFEEFVSLLGSDGLNLLRDIEVNDLFTKHDSSEKYCVLHFILANIGAVPFSALSAGTKRIIELVAYLIYEENSSVFIVEQPEDAIHSSLLYKLLSLLRSYSHNKQLFISSHDQVAINFMRPKELRIVSMCDGVSSIRPLTISEISQLEEYLLEDGELFDFLESLSE